MRTAVPVLVTAIGVLFAVRYRRRAHVRPTRRSPGYARYSCGQHPGEAERSDSAPRNFTASLPIMLRRLARSAA
jgi:hypothetical protein